MNKRLSAVLTGIVIIGAMALTEGCGISVKEPETSVITKGGKKKAQGKNLGLCLQSEPWSL